MISKQNIFSCRLVRFRQETYFWFWKTFRFWSIYIFLGCIIFFPVCHRNKHNNGKRLLFANFRDTTCKCKNCSVN